MLTRARRSPIRAVWRAWFAGDAGAPARLAAALGPEWGPAWREGLAATFEMLDGWRELVGKSDEAANHVVDVLADTVERGHDEIALAPDHPRRSPLATDIADLATLPVRGFVPLVPSLLARIAEERPEAGPELRSLRVALVQLAGPEPDEETEEAAAPSSAPPPATAAAVAPPVAIDAMSDATLLLPIRALDPLHLAAIRALVLARWEEVLTTWADGWERERVAGVLGGLAVTMLRKRETVRRLRELLGVELDYLSVRGDWGNGVWQAGNWDALERYAALAESNPSIRRLAEMLGRLEAERVRRDLLTPPEAAPPPRRVLHRRGSTEFRGVHFSADIDKLTTGELGLLATPELEHVFYMKLLDGRLLTYEQRGEDPAAPEPARVQAPPPREASRRGPIILCIDTSASMAGEPELIAKTMALAVLRVALKEGRACWAISYSHTADLRERELTRLPEALGELIQFLSMGFRGGTDPVPALQAAIRRLETTEFERADILWVTDGRFEVPEPFTRHVMALRATRPFRIHMLLVAPAEVPEIVDTCWEWREGRSFDSGALDLLNQL